VDEIAQVGPGGSFIDRSFTAEHFRRELWFPRLLDRDYYQAWLDNGAPSLEDRCRERKEEIMRTHQPEAVSDEVRKTLGEIVSAAREDSSE
jgi:trimethylamine:corrinoid methyltransferase-like protein